MEKDWTQSFTQEVRRVGEDYQDIPEASNSINEYLLFPILADIDIGWLTDFLFMKRFQGLLRSFLCQISYNFQSGVPFDRAA